MSVKKKYGIGILLEVDKQDLKRLACVIEKQKKNHNTSEYERKKMALHDKNREKASKRLQQYIEKEWIKGHNDLDFKNAHKEPGYVGLWSFEAAALAKILGLDDSALKDNNHYCCYRQRRSALCL